MIGIYIICFIVFPVTILINVHKVYAENEFLDRQDVTYIKGVATIFVVLAHLSSRLVGDSGKIETPIKMFTVMGGMGVLIFFFASGYGLYKGYCGKKLDMTFCYKRLMYVYLPSVMIQLVSCLIDMMKNQAFDIKNMMIYCFFGAWFIDVIMIQYIIFFIVWKIIKDSRDRMIWSFLVNTFVGGIFVYYGFNARWYNGLLLFPFGMLVAYWEKEIIKSIQKKWLLYLCISLLLFGIFGTVFTYYKGSGLWIDIVKTLSGIALCTWICITFCRLKGCSGIMRYIGKRSLYIYLIHINILMILSTVKEMTGIYVFYIVFVLIFPLTEIGYQICNAISRRFMNRHLPR